MEERGTYRLPAGGKDSLDVLVERLLLVRVERQQDERVRERMRHRLPASVLASLQIRRAVILYAHLIPSHHERKHVPYIPRPHRMMQDFSRPSNEH